MIWKNNTEPYMLTAGTVTWISEKPEVDTPVYFGQDNDILVGSINISDFLPINDTGFRSFVIQEGFFTHVYKTTFESLDHLLHLITPDGYYE